MLRAHLRVRETQQTPGRGLDPLLSIDDLADCTVVNFVSLPALCTLLWWQHRDESRWRSHARTVGVVAGLTIACVVPFAVVLLTDPGLGSLSDSALGLVDRCVVLLDVAALAALARWSRASAMRAPVRI